MLLPPRPLWLWRIITSAQVLPTFKDWAYVIAALAGVAAVALPFGIATGFLDPHNAVTNKDTVLKGCMAAFVAPGLLEEALFRSALLPHPAVDLHYPRTRAAFTRAAAAPLVVFVTYHLVNPSAQSRAVFWDWRFLTLSGILGAACSAVHWATGGCLLATAVTHWLPVCVWLFQLGGYQKLHPTGL